MSESRAVERLEELAFFDPTNGMACPTGSNMVAKWLHAVKVEGKISEAESAFLWDLLSRQQDADWKRDGLIKGELPAPITEDEEKRALKIMEGLPSYYEMLFPPDDKKRSTANE